MIPLLLLSGCAATYYTITYDANGAGSGSVPSSSAGLSAGATLTVPGKSGSLVKSGYTFIGWNTAADYSGPTYLEGSSYIIGTADATLYAHWSQTTHKLNFDANDGSGSMDEMTVAEGVEVVLPSNAFTRSAYAFSGWAESEDGSAAYSDGGSYTTGRLDTVLFAAWSLDIAANRASTTDGSGVSEFYALACDDTGSYDYGGGVTDTEGYTGNNSVIVNYR